MGEFCDWDHWESAQGLVCAAHAPQLAARKGSVQPHSFAVVVAVDIPPLLRVFGVMVMTYRRRRRRQSSSWSMVLATSCRVMVEDDVCHGMIRV